MLKTAIPATARTSVYNVQVFNIFKKTFISCPFESTGNKNVGENVYIKLFYFLRWRQSAGTNEGSGNSTPDRFRLLQPANRVDHKLQTAKRCIETGHRRDELQS